MTTDHHNSFANKISHAFTIRVPDCQQAYEILKARGAKLRLP